MGLTYGVFQKLAIADQASFTPHEPSAEIPGVCSKS